MTAQQLKNSILQMAVQGKLVPQNPDDEPASILLERIKAEKEELIKAGKIKKDKKSSEIFRGTSRNLPYAYCEQIGKEVRDISDEIPFDIPESWEWCRLSHLYSILNGDRGKNYPSKDKLKKHGIPFISAINLDGKRVIEDDKLLCVDEMQYNLLNNGKLNKDDIVVCIRGSLGKHARYQFDRGAIASSLVIMRSYYNSTIFTDYLMLYLDSPLFFTEIKKYDNGTAQPNLAAKSLEEFFIPLPPLSEQLTILEKIEELLPYIEAYEQAETQLTALNTSFPDMLKKSILQEAVQGKFVPQNPDDEPASVLLERIRAEKQELIKQGKIKKDKHESVIVTRDKIPYEIQDGKERCIADEVPFEIPESWCWCKWGNISESIQYGYNAPAKEQGRIKMVRISDIQENCVSWDTVPYCNIDEKDIQTYLLAPNDILFARTGGTVGKSYLVKSVPEEAIYAGYLIRTRYSKSLCPEYLKFFMESELYWSQLRDGTIATAQPNCNGKTLANMMIPIPPLAEQKRIVEKIEELMTFCEKL